MSKKVFVISIVLMTLATVSTLVLVLSGHETLVRDAFAWVASSSESVAEFIGTVVVLVLVLAVLS